MFLYLIFKQENKERCQNIVSHNKDLPSKPKENLCYKYSRDVCIINLLDNNLVKKSFLLRRCAITAKETFTFHMKPNDMLATTVFINKQNSYNIVSYKFKSQAWKNVNDS